MKKLVLRIPVLPKRVLLTSVLLTLVLCLGSNAFAAGQGNDQPTQSKASDRVQAAGEVLNEIQAAPDSGIPQEILGKAECVAVVPSMLKGGFMVGAKYGRGLASCRTPKGWSTPAFFTLQGGSFGFQIGGQAVDLVMLVMNNDGMRRLLADKFALGADASVAAGPVGRHAEGNTDWTMRAQVIRQDKDSTREFYGHMMTTKAALTGEVDPPAAAHSFLSSLAKWAQEAAK
jgi:lipid-binding SYLF domain-containing protein